MRAMRKPSLLAVALATFLTLGGILLFPLRETPADLDGPKAGDRQVTLIVSALLKQEHLLKRPLDDEISRRAIKTFLKQLDPMKVYFYQSDIDEFMQQQDRLDDFVETRQSALCLRRFQSLHGACRRAGGVRRGAAEDARMISPSTRRW